MNLITLFNFVCLNKNIWILSTDISEKVFLIQLEYPKKPFQIFYEYLNTFTQIFYKTGKDPVRLGPLDFHTPITN